MNTSLLKNIFNPKYFSLRGCSTKFVEPKEYPGFKYYPRHENFEDPPYEPSKLFLVTRIKSVKGTNPIERRSLQLLNIDGYRKSNCHRNIVKNIPEINEILWKVKHLVSIKPIRYTGELPKDGDYSGTFLKDSGEFIMTPKLKASKEILDASEKYVNEKKKFNEKYIKNYLLKKWVNGFSDIY